jgi:hypothetical protein
MKLEFQPKNGKGEKNDSRLEKNLSLFVLLFIFICITGVWREVLSKRNFVGMNKM